MGVAPVPVPFLVLETYLDFELGLGLHNSSQFYIAIQNDREASIQVMRSLSTNQSSPDDIDQLWLCARPDHVVPGDGWVNPDTTDRYYTTFDHSINFYQ